MKRWLSFILVFALTFQQIKPALAMQNNSKHIDANNTSLDFTEDSRSQNSLSDRAFTNVTTEEEFKNVWDAVSQTSEIERPEDFDPFALQEVDPRERLGIFTNLLESSFETTIPDPLLNLIRGKGDSISEQAIKKGIWDDDGVRNAANLWLKLLDRQAEADQLEHWYQERIKWLQKIDELKENAKNNDQAAQLQLGEIYETGRDGIAQDFAEASRLYKLAAKAGNSEGMYQFAKRLEADGDKEKALRWYHKAFKKGHFEAKQNYWKLVNEDNEELKSVKKEKAALEVEKDINNPLENGHIAKQIEHQEAEEALNILYAHGKGRWTLSPSRALKGAGLVALVGIAMVAPQTGSLLNMLFNYPNNDNIGISNTTYNLPLINGTYYRCPDGIQPLAYSNLLYLPNETCPERLNPELVSHAAEADDEDYFDYITHLQDDSTFAKEQKSIIYRCLKGVTNASSAIAHLDIRATAGRWFRKFWTAKDQSFWSFKLNAEQSKLHNAVSNKKICKYKVAYNDNSQGSLTTILDYPFRELGALPPRAISREFQVNNYTYNAQHFPAIASLYNGGFVITWQSHNQTGDGWDIFGQQYDFLGNRFKEEFLINSNISSGQAYSSIAGLSDGGFVTAWHSYAQDGNDMGVFGQRYNHRGNRLGGEFQVNSYTNGYQGQPSVAGLKGGGFVFIWQNSDMGIFGQLYNQVGARIGGEFQVNSYNNGYQSNAIVASLNNDNFVVVWHRDNRDGSTSDIVGRLYDHIGNRIGEEFRANSYTNGYQTMPSVAGLINGDFVITWQCNSQSVDYDIFGRLFNHAGTPRGEEFHINNYTTSYQIAPRIVGLNHGGFVVVWQSDGQDGSEHGIYSQRYTNNGTRIGNEFQINSYTNNSQVRPAVAVLNDGAFVVTWQSSEQDGSSTGIFARIFEH